MGIALGNTNIKEIYVGNNKIKEAYIGNTKVFGGGEEEEVDYLKISYDQRPTVYGDEYRKVSSLVNVNDSNDIVPERETELFTSIDFDVPFPDIYVRLSDSYYGQYFNINTQYAEYSYDKKVWNAFTSNDDVTLKYGESVYIRANMPKGSGSYKICIDTRNIDRTTTITYNSKQYYNYTEYYYHTDSTGSWSKDFPLVKISGNVQNIVNYSNPDYKILNSKLESLFRYCSSYLYDVKDLIFPWETIMYTDSFLNMFYYNKYIKTAPELPATTLSYYCYSGMFSGCTSLIKAPELPATTLALNCYSSMFSGCTNLVEAPELPATNLAPSCYYYMFGGCTSLIKAPEVLPATTLANECYRQMFYECSNLVKAPEVLPATTLASKCYYSMFSGCTSLVEAPDILALNIPENSECLSSMFFNCRNLNSIRVAYKGIYNNNFSRWLQGVQSIGRIFYDGEDTTTGYLAIIPTGWTKTPNYLVLEADNSTVDIKIDAAVSTLKYSYDLVTWNSFLDSSGAYNDTFRLSDKEVGMNKKIYIWNTKDKLHQDRYTKTSIGALSSLVGKYKIRGNINSLYNFSSSMQNNAYSGLFDASPTKYDSNSLTKAYIVIDNSNLVISDSEDLYSMMFYSNNSLKYPPSINEKNKITPSIYSYMFGMCGSLIRPPELPATTLEDYCYSGMFSGCTSLIKAPELPATTLATNCYGDMFSGCTNLVEAPELPSITLAPNCYSYMFSGCTSLIKAPELPATTLEDGCYEYMFDNCTKLNMIKMNYIGYFSYTFIFQRWVRKVSPTGDFYYNGEDTIRGESAIPTGWTIHKF